MNYVVTWDKLLMNAVRELDVRHSGGFPQEKDFLALLPAIEARKDPRKLLDEWYEEAEKIIRRWDVRMVKTLIQCFPSVVPKHCLNKKITAFMDDSSSWVVEFE